MYPGLLRRWTSFAVTFLMLGSLTSPAIASEISEGISNGLESFKDRDRGLNDFEIEFEQNDLNMRYGQYAEIEFTANVNEEVEFSLGEDMYPVGLQFQSIATNVALLGGTPEFIDEFCFTVFAKSKISQKEASERICIFAEKNEGLYYPGFVTDRNLAPLQKLNYGSAKIELDDKGSNIRPMFVLGAISKGLELDVSNGEMLIKGDAEEKGVYEFVVMSEDEGRNVFVYKQFVLEVIDQDQQGYQCPTGYYYDSTVGYCVQNAGDLCGEGTFYDPERNECVAYPSNTQCGPGQYYDHFLYRCVNNTYNRCPYNYEWDPYYNRCQRLPYTCSIGLRYSHLSNSCVYMGQRSVLSAHITHHMLADV